MILVGATAPSSSEGNVEPDGSLIFNVELESSGGEEHDENNDDDDDGDEVDYRFLTPSGRGQVTQSFGATAKTTAPAARPSRRPTAAAVPSSPAPTPSRGHRAPSFAAWWTAVKVEPSESA